MAINYYEVQQKNIKKTFMLSFFMLLIIGIAGVILDYALGTVFIVTGILLAITAIQILISLKSGSSIVLKSVGAKKVEENTEIFEEKQLLNIVEEMSISSGITMPEVYVMQDSSINAFATGTKKDKSYVCVTTGLLEKLNRDETTGVIAHELAHIKNRDVLLMTMVSALVGGVLLLAMLSFRVALSLGRASFYTGAGRRRSSKNSKGEGGIFAVIAGMFVVAAVMFVIGQVSRLMTFAISRKREYLADATAVELTRDPQMLSNALRKIHDNAYATKNSNGAIAHLFISEPKKIKLAEKKNLIANLFSTHPPLLDRIALIESKNKKDLINELSQK